MKKLLSILLIVFISSILYFPFLGNVHLFDWDEINFAEIAREMIVTGKYINAQIDFQNFTEKPPFFMWLQAISMKIFGINEFAARFPNALLGVLVSVTLFLIGYKTISPMFGWIWTILWWASILPHLYFKSGIIDPWFNFFIFIALYLIIRHYHCYKEGNKKLMLLTLAGTFCGLAILTKGPVSLLILTFVFIAFWISEKFRWFLPFWQYLYFLFISLITFSLWLWVDFALNGPDFLIEFTVRQWELLTTPDAGHRGFFGYHFVVLFFGCIPASALLIGFIFEKKLSEYNLRIKDYNKWMLILLSVVVVLFSIVKTKIVHYSSLSYYPVTFLGAYYAYILTQNKKNSNRSFQLSFIIQYLVLFIISFLIPFFFINKHYLTERIHDPFAIENLNAKLEIWPVLDFLPMIFPLISLILIIRWKFNLNFHKFLIVSILNIIWIQSFLYLHVGNIERISQNANITFFKSLINKDVYPITYNYKSYANLFYSKKKLSNNPYSRKTEWLLYGKTDKPVYISVRKYHLEDFINKIKDGEFIFSENGFYFFKREVQSKKVIQEASELQQ